MLRGWVSVPDGKSKESLKLCMCLDPSRSPRERHAARATRHRPRRSARVRTGRRRPGAVGCGVQRAGGFHMSSVLVLRPCLGPSAGAWALAAPYLAQAPGQSARRCRPPPPTPGAAILSSPATGSSTCFPVCSEAEGLGLQGDPGAWRRGDPRERELYELHGNLLCHPHSVWSL